MADQTNSTELLPPQATLQPRRFPAKGEPLIHQINWVGLQTLYMKEVRRFFKVQTQTIWAPAITTLLFLVIFSVALGRGDRMVLGVNFATFVAPGLIVMGMMQNAFANASFSFLSGKMQGTIIDFLMPPLSEAELMVAMIAAAVTRAVLVGLALAGAMLLWPGVCIVHEAFSETELIKLKAQHPGAPVAAHPECPPHIIDHADYVGSTSGILNYAKAFPGDTLIVATEPHIIHQMQLALPGKTFIGAPGADGQCSCNICPYMALNTLEKLYLALRDLKPQIHIEEGLRLAAKKSLDRMLDMAGGTVGKGDLGAR